MVGVARTLVLLLALVVTAAPVAAAGPRQPGTGMGAAPVGIAGMADPHVVRYGDVWFAFGTSHDGVNVPVAMTSDLATWTLAADAMPATTFPSWAVGPVWAPGVIEAEPGRWLLYFSAGWTGGWKRCIGVVVSDWPAGPYRAVTDRPLHCGATEDAWGAIDPFPYRDGDGSLHLAWKDTASDRQIWAAPLTPDGTALAAPPTHLLDGEVGWEDEGIEQPALVAAAGSWWLLYSGGWWTDGRYATGYARCGGPLGPCTKVTRDAPWLASEPGLVGPGAPSITTGPTGEPWLVFHTWPAARPGLDAGGARELRAWPVQLTPDGPVVGSRAPVGVLEAVDRLGPGRLRVAGWAADPDSPERPVQVVVRVGSRQPVGALTDRPRPDLAAFFGVARQELGFEVHLEGEDGAPVCVEVVGTAPGVHGRIGCLPGGS